MTVAELMAGLRDSDEVVRTETWQASASLGAAAVGPLAALSTDAHPEVARAAMRGLWAVTREAGRPETGGRRAEVVAALTPLTGPEHAEMLRRDAVWMLSEIGDDGCVPVLAGLLSDAALRDDARMALERIPGDASLRALRAGLDAAGEEFKPPIAHSLRVRGESAPGIPDTRLVPSRETGVTRSGEKGNE